MTGDFYIWYSDDGYDLRDFTYVRGDDLSPQEVEEVLKVWDPNGRLLGHVIPIEWEDDEEVFSIYGLVGGACCEAYWRKRFKEGLRPELWAKLAERLGLNE